MSQRKYSLSEIDQMRAAMWLLCAAETIHNDIYGVATSTVEDRLRTYMMNGSDPEEMTAYADRARLTASERKAA